MPKLVIIKDFNALRHLERTARHDGLSQIPQINLEFENLTTSDNNWYSNQLNVLKNACGCTFGHLFLMIAMVGLAIKYVLTGQSWIDLTWIDGFLVILVLFLAASLGKLIGLLIARIQFLNTLSILYLRVAEVGEAKSAWRLGKAKWGEHGTNLP